MAAKIKKRRLKPKFRKFLTVLAFATTFMGAVWVGNTVAYLVAKNAVANDFIYSVVSCAVIEEYGSGTIYNVQIQNTGDTTAYIRAYILATWKDADGNVNGVITPTEGSDYTIAYNSSEWTKIDDYYYYNSAVEPEKLTAVLIESCTYTDEATIPSDYGLSVEIIADAIQSNPDEAVQEAWSVDFSNGTPVEVE